MGITEKTAQAGTRSRRTTAFNLLRTIGTMHLSELSSFSTSPGVTPHDTEASYELRVWPTRYVAAFIHFQMSTDFLPYVATDQFNFAVRIGYGPGSPKYVTVHDFTLGSPDDIAEKVSEAIETAKRFQTREELEDFLRTNSKKT
jgi:hypothetical protein